jgi:hypothetical protein
VTIATVDVIHAIRIRKGQMLDGKVVEVDFVDVADGTHEIDADLMNERDWLANGYVALVAIDGEPHFQGACCGGH